MTNWQTAVTAIKTTAAGLQKSFNEFPRPIQIVIVISVLVYFVAIVQSYQSLGEAWRYDSWDFLYWSNPSLWAVLAFCPLAFLDRLTRLRKSTREEEPARGQ